MKVYLCSSAFAQLSTEIAQHAMVETGGILIGYETRDAVVISSASGPGPKARQQRYRIELDLTHIRQVAAAANDIDLQYQGSWHKHPVKRDPRPSFIDRSLLRRTANSRNYRLTVAVMIIANNMPVSIDDLRVFVCRRNERRIRTVEPVVCADRE